MLLHSSHLRPVSHSLNLKIPDRLCQYTALLMWKRGSSEVTRPAELERGLSVWTAVPDILPL